MFGGAVDWRGKVGILACDAGNVDNVLRATALAMLEEIRNRQLGSADRVSDININ